MIADELIDSLIEETLDTDLAALAAGIEAQQPVKAERQDKQGPKRAPLLADLPRREISHEPEDTTCGCDQGMKRIGQDVTEKLDYQPGVFSVERHVRGKWVCSCCETLVQAPMPACSPAIASQRLTSSTRSLEPQN